MIVCVCRRVSDHQIRQAVADGAHSLDCLAFELGVATQCGRCADCAQQVLGAAGANRKGGGHAAPTTRLSAAQTV
jgi:bacterioferritin-associated ferredoxin